MIIELDMNSSIPIYVQLRNQIVMGIGHGAVVAKNIDMDIVFREKLEAELELLSAEASITGMDKKDFLNMCDKIYSKMKCVEEKSVVTE